MKKGEAYDRKTKRATEKEEKGEPLGEKGRSQARGERFTGRTKSAEEAGFGGWGKKGLLYLSQLSSLKRKDKAGKKRGWGTGMDYLL